MERCAGGARCECAAGEVARVRAGVEAPAQLPRAVADALARVLPKTLRGTLVWEGRRSAVAALSAEVCVSFSAIEWRRAGAGCRARLGVISADTKIELLLDREESRPAGLKRLRLQTAEHYADLVARELGGLGDHATRLLQCALERFPNAESPKARMEPSAGAVISGLPGVGKTCFARSVAKVMELHLEFVDASSIFQTFIGHSEVELVKAFERALQKSPSILVIDGIESIAASRHASADSGSALEVGVLGTLLACLDRIKKESQPVFVIGTTTHPEDLDAAVVSNGRMDVAIKIEPPTQPQRREILQIMTSAWETSNLEESYLSQLSDATGGFVGADLLSLCQRALQSSLNDSLAGSTEGPVVLPRHFEDALASTFPSALQAHSISKRELTESNGNDQDRSPFSKVFGLDQAIEAIKVSLIEPLEDCSRFLTYGTVPPKGILLTGPPGSGKSHLALAIASEVQRRGLASFVSVRCTDLLTKVVGDTEKALRELFATARNAAPCVLYFDQIESIAPVRGFDTSTEQTFDRMLSMLLVEMDGFSTSRSKLQASQTSEAAKSAFLKEHVVILASTANKALLDPAILRPGRFDVHVELAYPDEAARRAIVLDALATIPLAYDQDPSLHSPEAVAAYVARHTSGQSAGDLASLFREAAMATLREDLAASCVAVGHVTRALTPDVAISVMRGPARRQRIEGGRPMSFRGNGTKARYSIRKHGTRDL